MARQRKKKTTRKARKAAVPRRRWPGRLWRAFLLISGIAAGLLIPWVLYLDYQVTSEFEGRKWDLPSRVYARALELYPGALLTASDLEVELEAAGYRQADRVSRPGQYRIAGNRAEVFRRAFRFQDGEEESLHLAVRFAGQTVGSLAHAPSGEALGLARLEPAEIASIYPLQKEDRTLVRIEDVPPLLVTGLQAVEDRNFKHHPGIDLHGIARAAWANVRAGRAVQGGSTLTQQLVKNFFLTRDRTVMRKANEAIMALLLEFHYEKAEILEAYLNEVFLGQQGAYAVHGFGRASQFYFDEPVERLRPHQVALLIGLVKGPSYYNPRRHPERARQRRDLVLAAFEETGLLTPEQARDAAARGLVTIAGNPVLSTPNGRQLDKALAGLEFMVSIDLYINETTRHARLILPPTGPLEHDHYDLSFHLLAMRNTTRYNPPVFARAEGALHDWEIFVELGNRLGTLLGQHALALSLIAFITQKMHQRVRLFPLWQQSLTVLVLLLIEKLLQLWVMGAIGLPAPPLLFWAPPVVGMLLWPWVFIILRDLRRRFQVS